MQAKLPETPGHRMVKAELEALAEFGYQLRRFCAAAKSRRGEH